MFDSQISKEEIKKLMSLPGKVRGQVFLTDWSYVKEKKGKEGIELLKKKMQEWGNPINYEKTEELQWYPVGLRALSLLAISEVFGWGEKEIFDMGNSAPKYSFIVKMLMKYFLSLQKTFEQASHYWEKHYLAGELETVRYSEKERYFILRLKNFKIHPILCHYYAGYFVRMGQYIQKSIKRNVKESKCVFKGDDYHEYILRWE